jgi:phage shock protein B
MIQDIYNALPKMEERIEALETILIERGHYNR